jgi:hypothetical protein
MVCAPPAVRRSKCPTVKKADLDKAKAHLLVGFMTEY